MNFRKSLTTAAIITGAFLPSFAGPFDYLAEMVKYRKDHDGKMHHYYCATQSFDKEYLCHGNAFYVAKVESPQTSQGQNCKGWAPVYRLRLKESCVLTMDKAELVNAQANLGWSFDAMVGYLIPASYYDAHKAEVEAQHSNVKPIYRLYKPGVEDHFFTLDLDDANNFVKTHNYSLTDILGYTAIPK